MYNHIYNIQIEKFQTHSPGLFSWFPIFLPLSNPIALEAGNKLELAVWRCNDSKRVWYEW